VKNACFPCVPACAPGLRTNSANIANRCRDRLIGACGECGFCGNENVAPPVVREAKALNFEPAPSPNGSSRWGAPLRVIRAVTVRYIRRWLAGWLLFRYRAPGFAGRALVLGVRPTGVGRFRIAGNRCGLTGGASSGKRNRKRGQSEKIRMKRKGGARITRTAPPTREDPRPPPLAVGYRCRVVDGAKVIARLAIAACRRVAGTAGHQVIHVSVTGVAPFRGCRGGCENEAQRLASGLGCAFRCWPGCRCRWRL